MLIRPFAAIHPQDELASQVSALPSGAHDRKGAAGKRLSFLNIDVPGMQFPGNADEVYARSRAKLEEQRAEGIYLTEEKPCLHLYELEMEGRVQIGVVACCSIDEYANATIKKHENTLEQKELDCIRRVSVLNAQTGPIYLTHRDNAHVDELVAQARTAEPTYSFVSDEGVRNTVWRITDQPTIDALVDAFVDVPGAYIADGHHRAAASVKVGFSRRAERAVGEEGESDYFLAVLFPSSQLTILPYNRVVRSLNGLTVREFFDRVTGDEGPFEVVCEQNEPYEPAEKGMFGMYLAGRWYGLRARDAVRSNNPVAGLDVSILQDHVLEPILGIEDPRNDGRILFVDGVRGVGELSLRVDSLCSDGNMAVAFSMYATSIDELMRVADADLLMPPKSTWFEPKLRSGLFIHDISS